jgi:hypothetical protein
VLVTSVTSLAFLPVARFSRWFLPNRSRCSLLKGARLDGFPDKDRAGPSLPPSSSFGRCGQNYLQCPVFLYLRLLLCVQCLRVWAGRNLHSVLTFIFRILTEGSTLRFKISSTRAFLKIPLDIFSLPKRSCFLCRCCIPIAPDVRPLEVSFATLSLSHPWRPCPLGRAGTARRAFPLRDTSFP